MCTCVFDHKVSWHREKERKLKTYTVSAVVLMNEQKAEEIEKGSISSLHASGQFDS